jgi:hypothetical protein
MGELAVLNPAFVLAPSRRAAQAPNKNSDGMTYATAR